MRFYTAVLIASTTFASIAHSQSASDLIAAGDRDFDARRASEALGSYEKAVAADPRSYEALWKASRSAVDIASYSTDVAGRTALFTRAEQYARRAVALNPADAEGHFSLARALGKTALTQSIRGRVRYATEIRARALDCLKSAPRHAGCLHVMGMWNAEVMRLNSFSRMIARNVLGGGVMGTASWKEAVRFMEAAVASEPERIVHRIDLAEVYRDVGERDKARAELETALRLPISDVNDTIYKEQAKAALGGR